jgi:hypothetical protein
MEFVVSTYLELLTIIHQLVPSSQIIAIPVGIHGLLGSNLRRGLAIILPSCNR